MANKNKIIDRTEVIRLLPGIKNLLLFVNTNLLNANLIALIRKNK